MSSHSPIPAALFEFLGSARLASALSTTAIGLGVFAWTLHNVIGWGGLIGMLVALVVLCAGSLYARRGAVDWTGLMPISLLLFVGWAGVSIFWSEYQWVTFASLSYLLAFTVLGFYVALMRDTIQIIRSFGDVLRFLFVLSLVLEIFSGLLVDTPIHFLDIRAQLDAGGPISGLLSNRNELGLLAVVGGISFAIEWRTRSVTNQLAIGSISLAVITLILTQSPIGWGTAVVSTVAMVVLYGIRRLPLPSRRVWQFVALGIALAVALLAWLFRSPIVSALNAGGELNYRLRLWQEIWALVPLHSVQGWGWVGQWNTDITPYSQLGSAGGGPASSAANAYLDVWLQLGIIGVATFVLVAGLAFVRSWLLAIRQRSVIFTWPAVVLAALLTASLAESTILVEFGWLTFIVCCVKASQSLSWRTAFRKPLVPEPL
ncbi:MAG: O-antigen ligase family protein [Homoserinimonas sp.]